MKIRLLLCAALALALGGVLWAQDAGAPPQGQEQGGRGAGRGMGMGFGAGRGVMGTVTEVAPDHFTVKNESGETWTIHYSVNTRMMKQPARPANAQPRGQAGAGSQPGAGGQPGAGNQPDGQGQGGGRMYRGGNPPEPIKATDIKVGDAVMAMGEMDQNAKSVGAVMVMQLDPDTAKRMEEMRANYGKTWLAGRVTAINETTLTIEGMVDSATHTFVVNENTEFRKRRDPVTLADIQVGDGVRVDGALKDGQFVAATVNVMGPQANGGPARRQGAQPQ